MATRPKMPLVNLLTDARFALSMTQSEFGYALGASHRTASRWYAGQSRPSENNMRELARRLFPVDPALAAEAASHTGETLEDLGLAAPPPPAPNIGKTDLIDIVVCAAADLADASPRALRSVLHAAFKRARELGLCVAEAEAALAADRSRP